MIESWKCKNKDFHGCGSLQLIKFICTGNINSFAHLTIAILCNQAMVLEIRNTSIKLDCGENEKAR